MKYILVSSQTYRGSWWLPIQRPDTGCLQGHSCWGAWWAGRTHPTLLAQWVSSAWCHCWWCTGRTLDGGWWRQVRWTARGRPCTRCGAHPDAAQCPHPWEEGTEREIEMEEKHMQTVRTELQEVVCQQSVVFWSKSVPNIKHWAALINRLIVAALACYLNHK